MVNSAVRNNYKQNLLLDCGGRLVIRCRPVVTHRYYAEVVAKRLRPCAKIIPVISQWRRVLPVMAAVVSIAAAVALFSSAGDYRMERANAQTSVSQLHK